MLGTLVVAVVIVVFAMILVSRIARVVPQQQAWVIERLGKFSGTLNAGFHILIPFMDSVRYKHSLKEIAIDSTQVLPLALSLFGALGISIDDDRPDAD